MIRIRIELCPFGDERESAVRELGRMYIANTGTGTPELGDYVTAVCRRGSTRVPAPINPKGPVAVRSGEVRRYRRLRYNPWRLVARALLAAFPEEAGQAPPLEVTTSADDVEQEMRAS